MANIRVHNRHTGMGLTLRVHRLCLLNIMFLNTRGLNPKQHIHPAFQSEGGGGVE